MALHAVAPFGAEMNADWRSTLTIKYTKTIILMPTYQQLTPQGRGAIAVIAVQGNEAQTVIDACFTPIGKRKFKNVEKQLTYGHWNSTGEDLLVVASGQQTYEIQSHGSDAAVAAIKADLAGQGVTEQQPLDYPPLSSARFKSDIEALLSKASTQRTAELLLRQWHILPPSIERLIQEPKSPHSQQSIQSLLQWSSFGTRFHQRQSIVFCGNPNAGKSSLTNAILGFERAIVTPIAGTTRDVLTHHSVIDGWPVELSDTAGLRESTNQIEQIGVAKARQQIQNADLVIAVIDATDPVVWDSSIVPQIVVVNKTDLSDAPVKLPIDDIPIISVSATQGSGIAELLSTISQTLFPLLPPQDQPIPLTKPQAEDIARLREKT